MAKRRLSAPAPPAPAAAGACWLCGRPLGARVEQHHPVPKSRGGRTVEPVHPICHRALHAAFTNRELEGFGDDRAALAADARLAPFLRWVANKPPDFHAPTRRASR